MRTRTHSIIHRDVKELGYLYTIPKMTSFRKNYIALRLELELGLVKIRFQPNVISSKCSRTRVGSHRPKFKYKQKRKTD